MFILYKRHKMKKRLSLYENLLCLEELLTRNQQQTTPKYNTSSCVTNKLIKIIVCYQTDTIKRSVQKLGTEAVIHIVLFQYGVFGIRAALNRKRINFEQECVKKKSQLDKQSNKVIIKNSQDLTILVKINNMQQTINAKMWH